MKKLWYLSLYRYSFYTALCIIAYLFFKIFEAYVDVYHGIIQIGLRMDFIGKFGLILLFGKKIIKYTYLFLPIIYISSLTALSWFIGLMLTVVREFKGLIISSVIAATICFFGSKIFINRFGVNGASYILIPALVLQIVLMGFFYGYEIKGFART